MVEEFIDAESQGANEKNSFDDLVLQQIRATMQVLSKDQNGGGIIKTTKTGEQYVEDIRIARCNSVTTLRDMMTAFIEDGDKFDKRLKEIDNEIKKKWEQLGETTQLVRGQGYVKVKDMSHLEVDNVVVKKFDDFKSQKAQEIFNVLMSAYVKYKSDIASLSEE